MQQSPGLLRPASTPCGRVKLELVSTLTHSVCSKKETSPLRGDVSFLWLSTCFVVWESAFFVLFLRRRSRSLQQICHNLIELCSVLGGNNRDTRMLRDSLLSDSSNFAALVGYDYIHLKYLWNFLI